MSELSERVRRSRQAGFSLIELLIVIAIILVILAIALPQVNKSLMNANEMAAVKQIHTIQTGQTQYYSQFGKYAASLKELGPPAGGAAGPAASDLIPGSLSSGTHSGYTFTVSGSAEGYAITANPVAFNSTGRRTFYSDQSLVIRQNWGNQAANATSEDFK